MLDKFPDSTINDLYLKVTQLNFPNELANLEFNELQAKIYQDLVPKVNLMNTTEEFDEGQITSFRIDTKRLIEDLMNEIENKVAKYVESTNEKLYI